MAAPQLHSRTIIILDSEQLRRDERSISDAISWERTAQDLVVELRRNETLRWLQNFQHVIVRMGYGGALHVHRHTRGHSYDLYFDPTQDEAAFTDADDEQRVLGSSSLLCASLLTRLTSCCYEAGGTPYFDALQGAIENGLRDGLIRTRRLGEFGYGEKIEDFECRNSTTSWLPESVLAANLEDTFVRKCRIARIEVPLFRSTQWSILAQSCNTPFFNAAKEIVLFGVDRVLNQPAWSVDLFIKAILQSAQSQVTFSLECLVNDAVCDASIRGTRPLEAIEPLAKLLLSHLQSVWHDLEAGMQFLHCANGRNTEAVRRELQRKLLRYLRPIDNSLALCIAPIIAPVTRFGRAPKDPMKDDRMIVVDQQEIEGFRILRKCIRSHLGQVERARGEGEASSRGSLERRPLSLALFGPPGSGKSYGVKKIIQDVVGSRDTVVNLGQSLAELNHPDKLADVFQQITRVIAEQKIPVMFFDEFDSTLGSERLGWLKYFLAPMEDGTFRGHTVADAIFIFAGGTSTTYGEFSHENRSVSDPQWGDFSRAKGPDFISRLTGYVDVMGINAKAPDDDLYIIRRAVLLRSFLKQMLDLTETQTPKIDEGLLNALLRIPEYRHGARSMRIVLGHCIKRNVASKSSLPTLAQLNMHVNGKAFVDLI